MLMPMIDMGMRTARMQMQQQAQGNPQAKQAAQWMNVGGNAMKALLSGMRGLAISLDAPATGVSLTAAAGMVEGSELAKALPGAQTSALALLDHVPDEPFLLAGGYDLDAIDLDYLMQSMLEAMPEQAQGDDAHRHGAEDVPRHDAADPLGQGHVPWAGTPPRSTPSRAPPRSTPPPSTAPSPC